MRFLALIQARCGSERLPNKVLKKISGKPDIQWVIERVRRSKYVDEVMVITSIEKNNIPLIRLCAETGTRVFVGSENDVLDRYYQAAKLLQPEYIIRITADCPLFDWRYLDHMIESMNDSIDYLTEVEGTFPDGLDCEIIRLSALKKAWKNADLQSEREHVTPYIRNHPELFNICKIICPIEGIGYHRWTLDEDEDFLLINSIIEHFMGIGKEDFVTEDILEFLNDNPDIVKANSHIGRNEGYAKSLNNDHKVNTESYDE